jgi:hypothetical protein
MVFVRGPTLSQTVHEIVQHDQWNYRLRCAAMRLACPQCGAEPKQGCRQSHGGIGFTKSARLADLHDARKALAALIAE